MAPDRPAAPKRSAKKRGGARKGRPAPGAKPPAPAVKTRAARGERPRRARARARERPPAPWHPLPLSELLILVGAVAVIIAFSGHLESNFALLGAGIAAVALGTLEVTLREHLGGYRQHTILLAAIPPIALHSLVIFALAGFIRVPRWVNVPLLAIDIGVFWLLYRHLRGRYLDARRALNFARGR